MKKVKFVALILVLAFGLIGGAYAAWTDQLFVNGTVATGDIDVVFTSAVSNDPGNTGDPGQPEGKDVAATEVEIIDGGKALQVTVSNAYPGYVSKVDYCVTNNGSVPVKLQEKTIWISDEDALEVENWGLWCFNCRNWVWNCTCGCPPPPPPPNLLEIGSQIHEGDTFEGSIGHVVTDDAIMNGSYTYKITYDFVQWNFYQE
jgi:predicted ribosomally synthesized peptide with SipW-like signal peptide